MGKLFITSCPLCGSDDFEHQMSCSDQYVSEEEFDLYRCRTCGFTFTQGVPDGAEIGSYYKSSRYISHSNVKSGLTNRLYHLARTYMLGRKSRLVGRVSGKSSGLLLDIGTGTGYFPAAMHRRGWQVEAVEKDPQAREFAQKKFGMDVLSEEELDRLPHKRYDVITLWHVMEHIEDINGLWDRLYRLLSDEGVLVVALPNCSSTDAIKYGSHWAAYDVPRHLWHFTPDTVRQLAGNHHFKLVDRYPMPLDAFYVSILSEKYRKSSFTFIRGVLSGLHCWFGSMG